MPDCPRGHIHVLDHTGKERLCEGCWWMTGPWAASSHQYWPAPVMIDSGNGYHLLYRIDLPADDVSKDLLRRVLKEVKQRFTGSDGAAVDTGTDIPPPS